MESELRQLQIKCLEILDIVVNICQKYNINYSLCGGSIVGAHLYQGFLPWDDDIDLMMTRENYNRFLEVAEDNLPKGFSIVNYQNSDLSTTLGFCYTKIINDNTTLVQKNGKIMGVFLDITVYDRVPNNILKYIDIFLYKRAMMVNRGKMPGKGIKKRIRDFILDTICSNRRNYLKFTQKIIEIISNSSSDYTYREIFGCYYFANMIPYKASIFENYTTIKFEGRNIKIVRDYIDYLQTRYNRTNFHEPKEKQVPIHYAYIDLNIPFREYKKGKNKTNS